MLTQFMLCAQSLAAALTAISHSGLLTSPLLPHYQRRLVMEKLSLLRLPSVPTSHLLTDSEEYLTRLASHQPPPSILLRLVQTPRRFKDMTRLSVPEFIALYKELKPYILRSLPVERKRCHRHYPRSLHSADEFLLWVWHSDGTDADVLGFFFNGISRWTATRIADHVTTAVLDAWAEEVSWPDAEERRLLYGFFTCHEKAVGALDGTHCQISVPYFKEDRSMSGYKKFHTQNYMICVDGLGFVIYTAGPFEGMANDRAALNTTPFVEFPCPMLSEGELILTDGGFAGDGEILHQFTQNELARLTADERQNAASWNEDFGYNRTLIEHCIHRIKTRTQALAHRWQRDVSRQSELFSASCRLYNRLRRLRLEYAWSSRHA